VWVCYSKSKYNEIIKERLQSATNTILTLVSLQVILIYVFNLPRILSLFDLDDPSPTCRALLTFGILYNAPNEASGSTTIDFFNNYIKMEHLSLCSVIIPLASLLSSSILNFNDLTQRKLFLQ
jgi:hypothetical protein